MTGRALEKNEVSSTILVDNIPSEGNDAFSGNSFNQSASTLQLKCATPECIKRDLKASGLNQSI